jgi:ABC-type lipoprotein export system ATPase subunit
MIELQGITKSYENRVVLNDLSLTINKGDAISIAGESGSGKSTFLNILGTLDSEYTGNYLFEGRSLSSSETAFYRNETMGFIFQQYHLIPTLTVMENILVPYYYCKRACPGIRNKAKDLLLSFGMANNINQYVNTLSGGEQQRIAMIRSMILDPPIIIADEPTGNLDRKNAEFVTSFLFKQNGAGKTIVAVTHDESLAKRFPRQYILSDGKLNARSQTI